MTMGIEALSREQKKNELKFYYVESLDDYWVGRRLDNFYYATWHGRLGFIWSHSKYLPWGEHIVDENTLWKKHIYYPSEPIEIPFTEWIVGFVKKYFAGPKLVCEDAISRADAIKTFINWSQKEFGYSDINREERFIDAINTLPPVEPKPVCEDVISRQAAIDAMWKALYTYEDLTEKQFIEHEELKLEDWFQHRIFVQRMHEECMKSVESLQPVEPKGPKTDIVRCKDCRHAEHRKQMPNQVYCKRDKLSSFGAAHDDDAFCKYGERREP